LLLSFADLSRVDGRLTSDRPEGARVGVERAF
jgi:hypothetical protein